MEQDKKYILGASLSLICFDNSNSVEFICPIILFANIQYSQYMRNINLYYLVILFLRYLLLRISNDMSVVLMLMVCFIMV